VVNEINGMGVHIYEFNWRSAIHRVSFLKLLKGFGTSSENIFRTHDALRNYLKNSACPWFL